MHPLFKNSRFQKYLALRFGIIFAMHMQYTALSFTIFSLTQDNWTIGMMSLWEVIAAVGGALIAGEIVDRTSKIKILKYSIVTFIVLSLSVLYITRADFLVSHSLQTVKYSTYLIMFFIGLARAFGGPATFSLLSILVQREEYNKAITSSSAAWQTGAVLGPLAGGILLAYTSMFFVEICVIVILLVILFLLVSIKINEIFEHKSTESFIEKLREGFQFVFKKEIIWGAITLDLFAVFFGGAEVLLPDFATNILMVGEVGYGWLKAAHGIGSILMISWISRHPLKQNPGKKMLWSVAGYGVCMIGFGLSRWGWLSFLCLLLAGMFDAISVIVRQSILQIYTPENMKGRVSAISSMFINSSNELGGFESGVSAKLIGTVPSVLLGGTMTILVVGIMSKIAPKLKTISLEK